MAEAMKKALYVITETLQFPSDLFSVDPGSSSYKPLVYDYLSTEEAWRHDWKQIGGDFRRAFSKLEKEQA